MSQESHNSNSVSEQDQKDKKTKEKTNALVKSSARKKIFLYDKKCRTILNIGILYKELSTSKANSINLTQITDQIQKMIDENEIYLRDVGPIILGITKIIVKKTNILLIQIQNLTKLRLKVEPQKAVNKKDDNSSNDTSTNDIPNKNKNILGPSQITNTNFLNGNIGSYDTNMMNLNSLQSDVMSYRQQSFKKNFNKIKTIDEDVENGELNDLLNKNYKNKLNLTAHKSIVEFGNDDVIRKTIEKMSKKETTNEKIFKSEKNKNSKTLQNLQDMLGNNKKNNFDSNLRNDFNNINDADNQDMTGFFTVLKSEIQDNVNDYDIHNDNNDITNNNITNNNISRELNNFKFNFSNIKMNDNNLSLNDTEIIKANIQNNVINDKKKPKKTGIMPKARLKYDDEFEYNLESEDISENQKQNDIEEYENKMLQKLQEDTSYLTFDKNKLISYTNEKYEYLMPEIFNEKNNYDDITDNISELRGNDSVPKSDGVQLNNNLNTSSDKRDLTRLERITTSNKKKISLGNFETENNNLLLNLSRLTLNRDDFQGSLYIDQIRDVNKENDKSKINLDENDEMMFNNQVTDYINNENYENNFEENNEKYLCDDKKEEEDVELLKNDLDKNVFKEKNKITFTKIRDKLDNKDKFIEPKLFYDLLLLAQKEEIEMTQNKLMENSSITISVKN